MYALTMNSIHELSTYASVNLTVLGLSLALSVILIIVSGALTARRHGFTPGKAEAITTRLSLGALVLSAMSLALTITTVGFLGM